MKKAAYFLIIFILGACSVPEPKPEDVSDWSVSNVSVGQREGKVVLTWADPEAAGLSGIGITVTDSAGRTVKEEKAAPGTETLTVSGLQKGETYAFKLTGYGRNSRENAVTVMHTVSIVDALLTECRVYDLTADFAWEISGISETTSVKMVSDRAETLSVTENRASLKVLPGVDYTFQLTVTEGDKETVVAAYKTETLLFWEDFADTGSGVEPDPKKWGNPYDDSSCVGGPNEGKESLHGNSAWNNALVSDWSMVEFLEEDGTTFIRFKGAKENGKAKASGVQSRNHFYFTYGRIEFRARLKENNPEGHFPALWLMPQQSGRPDGLTWPLGGEIDVMEHVRRNSQISQTVHSEKASPAPFHAGDHVYINVEGEQSVRGHYRDWENWHIFAMEWTKDGLFWYLDGKHTRTFNKNMKDPAWYPFSKDSAFYIIMNMGVGRSTDAYPGGAADGFSAHMDVDYVRVIPNGDTIVRDCPYYR